MNAAEGEMIYYYHVWRRARTDSMLYEYAHWSVYRLDNPRMASHNCPPCRWNVDPIIYHVAPIGCTEQHRVVPLSLKADDSYNNKRHIGDRGAAQRMWERVLELKVVPWTFRSVTRPNTGMCLLWRRSACRFNVDAETADDFGELRTPSIASHRNRPN